MKIDLHVKTLCPSCFYWLEARNPDSERGHQACLPAKIFGSLALPSRERAQALSGAGGAKGGTALLAAAAQA